MLIEKKSNTFGTHIRDVTWTFIIPCVKRFPREIYHDTTLLFLIIIKPWKAVNLPQSQHQIVRRCKPLVAGILRRHIYVLNSAFPSPYCYTTRKNKRKVYHKLKTDIKYKEN